MKLVKMSLAAAMLMGASAYAIENVKVGGNAKLFYATNDADYVDADGNTQSGLFDQGSSAGQAALSLGITADLTKGVSAGAKLYAISTLGLENNLVGNVWESGVQDQYWFGEAWLAATAGKTTGKIGRMELDTPLAFSEKWSIVPNTFEAVVVMNQDIPDTTLVGAYIGKGNGSAARDGAGYGGALNSFENTIVSYIDVNNNGVPDLGEPTGISTEQNNNFASFGQGAYAAGLINNSFKPLTFQAWYYNALNIADAYWLQADIDCSLVKGVKIGAQYTEMDSKGLVADVEDAKAYAVKLGYEGIENLKLSVAYSDVDDRPGVDNALYVGNLATNTVQSKLYTEAFWNRGYVGLEGSESWNAKASYDVKDVAKFCVSYTDVDNVATGADAVDMTEVALSATKSFGPLDARVAYFSTDADDENNGKRFDSVHVYLTYNF